MGKKIHTNFSLWRDILLDKNKVAMAKMIKYCKMDVVLLEKVYKQLSTHVMPKTHYGVIFGSDRSDCPECGSDDCKKSGFRVTASGTKYQRYQCNTCFKYYQKLLR
jgi:hypothetical protein